MFGKFPVLSLSVLTFNMKFINEKLTKTNVDIEKIVFDTIYKMHKKNHLYVFLVGCSIRAQFIEDTFETKCYWEKSSRRIISRTASRTNFTSRPTTIKTTSKLSNWIKYVHKSIGLLIIIILMIVMNENTRMACAFDVIKQTNKQTNKKRNLYASFPFRLNYTKNNTIRMIDFVIQP